MDWTVPARHGSISGFRRAPTGKTGFPRRWLSSALKQRLLDSPTANTWASALVRALNVFLVLPLVLKHLSEAEIALWSVFSTLIFLQTVLDFGFQSTFTRLTAYAFGGADPIDPARSPGTVAPEGSPNWPLVRRIAATTRWIYGRLSWALFGLLAVPGSWALWRRVQELASGSGPTADALHPSPTTPAQAWLAWSIIVGVTTVQFRGNWMVGYLAGTGHLARVRRWEALFGLASLATTPWVLWWSHSLLAMVAVNQTWILLGVLRNRWLSRRLNGGLLAETPTPLRDAELLRTAWPQAWRSGIGSWAALGSVHLGSLVYAQVPDSKAVASYLVSLRLAQTVSVMAGGAVFSRLPNLAEHWSRRRLEEFRREANQGTRLALWATAAALGLLAWVGPWLLGTALRTPVPFAAAPTWSLLSLALFAERFGGTHLAVASATNRIHWHVTALVSGAIFLVVGATTYRWLGVDALPLGMLAGAAGFVAPYARRSTRAIPGFGGWDFDRRTSFGPAALLLALLLARFVTARFP